jgi:CheY-like chemotaxis protein
MRAAPRCEDGHTFLEPRRRLEQQQNLPRIPAVAVTAFARPADRDRAIAAGFDHHLAKPLNGEKLAAVLSQLIQTHARQKCGSLVRHRTDSSAG